MNQVDDTLLEDIIDFYRNWVEDDLARFAQNDERTFEISLSDVRTAMPDVADDYLEEPDTIHEHFEVALDLVELPYPVDFSDARVRINELDATGSDYVTFDVGDYSPTNVAGQSAIVRGQVAQRTKAKSLPTQAIWECKQCGARTEIDQPKDAELQEPYECRECERQGPFVPKANEMARRGVDYQKIQLQRPPEKSQGTGEETLDIELQDDLVKSVEPGDRVSVLSDVRALVTDGSEPALDMVGEAQSVETLESDFEDIDFEEHRETIESVANSNDPYQAIVDSIAPTHYGNQGVKEAIAYQLFGGVQKDLPDGSEIRGTIHIFMIGDPGVGKSAILRYVNKLAPRSVYTSGTGSTAAGLTAAAMQDDFGDGGWTLKAGALVESHKGICCVDELDDMAEEDRSGMLEAMSDQQISISKAGMNTTLPARTTVLAAANPKLGRWDPNTQITEQLDIHPALLSRFDLIFALKDQPDTEQDSNVAEHMTKGAQVGQQRARDGSASGSTDDVEPELSPDVMRAYIALAREKKPVLTDEARNKIEAEYVSFRQASDDSDHIPTTARMVESLTRLAEASARIRLGDEVRVDDVQRAIEIYHEYMKSFGVDPESGDFDVDIIETGTGGSQRNRVRAIQKVISSLGEEYDRGAPIESVVDHPTLSDFGDDDIRHEIDQLKDKGKIYEPSDGRLRTT